MKHKLFTALALAITAALLFAGCSLPAFPQGQGGSTGAAQGQLRLSNPVRFQSIQIRDYNGKSGNVVAFSDGSYRFLAIVGEIYVSEDCSSIYAVGTPEPDDGREYERGVYRVNEDDTFTLLLDTPSLYYFDTFSETMIYCENGTNFSQNVYVYQDGQSTLLANLSSLTASGNIIASANMQQYLYVNNDRVYAKSLAKEEDAVLLYTMTTADTECEPHYISDDGETVLFRVVTEEGTTLHYRHIGKNMQQELFIPEKQVYVDANFDVSLLYVRAGSYNCIWKPSTGQMDEFEFATYYTALPMANMQKAASSSFGYYQLLPFGGQVVQKRFDNYNQCYAQRPVRNFDDLYLLKGDTLVLYKSGEIYQIDVPRNSTFFGTYSETDFILGRGREQSSYECFVIDKREAMANLQRDRSVYSFIGEYPLISPASPFNEQSTLGINNDFYNHTTYSDKDGNTVSFFSPSREWYVVETSNDMQFVLKNSVTNAEYGFSLPPSHIALNRNRVMVTDAGTVFVYTYTEEAIPESSTIITTEYFYHFNGKEVIQLN